MLVMKAKNIQRCLTGFLRASYIHLSISVMVLSLVFRAKLRKVCGFSVLAYAIQRRITPGLACTAVHQAEQTELVPPSFFAKLSEPGILASLTSRLPKSLTITPAALEEKRPTFAFLRRIRDHTKFLPTSLGHSIDESQYSNVVTKEGTTLTELVDEWANEWLEDTRSDADVEKRLKGMVEEVVWGNTIWFGVGGWHARGTGGRPFNADFFVCVRSFLLICPRQNSRQCSSSNIRNLLAHRRSPLRRFTLPSSSPFEPPDAS